LNKINSANQDAPKHLQESSLTTAKIIDDFLGGNLAIGMAPPLSGAP